MFLRFSQQTSANCSTGGTSRRWCTDPALGQRGGPRQDSALAIDTARTLRLIFPLPLRQTEGVLTSIFWMLDLDISAPDHTPALTAWSASRPHGSSRAGGRGHASHRRPPGLSIVGDGAWAAVKHGGRGRRGWKKRHLGVDGSGVIIAHALPDAHVDDATTGTDLIEAVVGDIARVTADAAYDTIAFYESAGARDAQVVVPPATTATVSRRGPRVGDSCGPNLFMQQRRGLYSVQCIRH